MTPGEVFQAWYDGKPLQYRRKNSEAWHDLLESVDYFNKLSISRNEWRIKPEKKKGWISLLGHDALPLCSSVVYSTKEQAIRANSGSSLPLVATIEIEWEEQA